MLVPALGPDVQVASCPGADRLEEMAEHLGRDIADLLTFELRVPFEINTPSEVHQDSGVTVVHREDEAVAGHAEFRAERGVDRFSEDDSDILNRVMLVQRAAVVPQGGACHAAVVRDLIKHVVEERETGGNVSGASDGIQIQFKGNLCLFGITDNSDMSFA